ncbi:hypothetical protein T4E_7545 [Trichinella pseudospiralis]|uniref:Uncharacterized protein n=1 Tax=Trichinella pseudospiralis TaxID=6337 RepID=A0A0V0YLJ9_TRIPS|nr:hypothetical protein T4E_7545 [Trichinella pseudospiralis]
MSIDALIDTCLTMSYIKVRVFDGSARLHHSSELYLMNSLDTLEVRPNLQINLLTALLRFTRYRVWMQAGI